jgi:hypothetical protein
MAAHLRYHISLDEEAPVTCESLSLAPLTITYTSLEADEATLTLLPGGTPIPHDTPATLYAQAGTGDLTQIFTGRVNSPETTKAPSGPTTQIRIAGGLASFRDFTFTRSRSPAPRSPLAALFRSRTQNNQTLNEAVLEVAELMQDQVASLPGWTFSVSGTDIAFGPTPLQPDPTWENTPQTCQEWLIKLLRVQPDAYSHFDHTTTTPTLRAGRFRDVTSLTFPSNAPPTISVRTRRRQDQEFSGIRIALDEFPSSDTVLYARPVIDLSTTPSGQEWETRLNFPLIFDALPELWSSGIAEALTANFLNPWLEGGAVFSFAGDTTLLTQVHPGAVLLIDGDRLNIQSTTLDLRNGILSASIGPPRQLGINDITRLARWIRRFKQLV